MAAMDARTLLGRNLRKLRVERGFSQERLALEAKIDRAYVGRIERGSENVTIARLEALFAVLGVSIKEFFAEIERGNEAMGLRPGRKPKG